MKITMVCLAASLLALASSCNDTTGERSAYTVSDSKVQFESLSSPDPTEARGITSDSVTSAEPLPPVELAFAENPFVSSLQHPLSTFSIDVDDAAYSTVRSYLNNGSLPPRNVVRIEEMVNYFDYDYAQPAGDDAFAVSSELGECPWNDAHQLLHIGLQGKTIETSELPPANLVFLVDVSGSMAQPNKLPLVKASLQLLTDRLRDQDRVAIVTYAGNAGLALSSTTGKEKSKIKAAIGTLDAGGSTAGGEGIELAYQEASKHFIKGGNNRVILATDGDFNVGISSEEELVAFIEKKRATGIFLSVLGVGLDNYQDGKMQELADRGNGNHSYIDNIREAQKVLISEFGSTLFTIASDVKIQIEFNPARVAGYRLIGYENRMLADRDFTDDTKDAGEIGSGHTVTALYEIIPAGTRLPDAGGVDQLKYQVVNAKPAVASADLMTLKLRYKQPGSSSSKLIEHSVAPVADALSATSDNFRFSASVAAFGMLLGDSKHKGSAGYDMVISLAKASRAKDAEGYRDEFIRLAETTASLPKR